MSKPDKGHCKSCWDGGWYGGYCMIDNCPCHHTTTQKKECCPDCNMVCDGVTCPCHKKEFAGASYVSEIPSTPSINEIIKEAVSIISMWALNRGMDEDKEENFRSHVKSELTSFESRIRAQEMTKSLSASQKDTSLCYIFGRLVTAVEFLEHHQEVGAAIERTRIADLIEGVQPKEEQSPYYKIGFARCKHTILNLIRGK